MKSSHDLLTNDPTLSQEVVPLSTVVPKETKAPAIYKPVTLVTPKSNSSSSSSEDEELVVSATQNKISQLQKEIRELKQKGTSVSNPVPKPEEVPLDPGKAFLLGQKEKYASKAKRNRTRRTQEETLFKFEAFRSKLHGVTPIKEEIKVVDEKPCALHSFPGCQSCKTFDATAPLPFDQADEKVPEDWLAHSLQFPQERMAGKDRIEDYEIIDPRQEAKKKAKPNVLIQGQTSPIHRDNISSIHRFK